MDRGDSLVNNLILFDGVCNLCNSSVNFIVKNDSKHIFRFASLQSEIGQRILKQHHKNTTEFNSVILINEEKFYEKSDAVLQIVKDLNGLSWLSIFRFVPRFIRDVVYDFIAANRYSIFGKSETCRIPSPEERELFLG